MVVTVVDDQEISHDSNYVVDQQMFISQHLMSVEILTLEALQMHYGPLRPSPSERGFADGEGL